MTDSLELPANTGFDVSKPQFFLNASERDTVVDGKTSFTIDEAAVQLLRKGQLWSFQGTAASVTYGFRASEPTSSYLTAAQTDIGGFQRFNSNQIDTAELALKGWSDVANITFLRVGAGNTGEQAYTDNAAILFGDYTTGEAGASAFGFYPGSRSASNPAGDVWVNVSLGDNANPQLWEYGPHVLAHEIGHAIGLAHPGDYNASENANPTYAADAVYYEDTREYTIMSYFGSTNSGGFLGAFAASPQLDDIAAAQRAYGANMSTRLGDTVYGFNATADRPWFSIPNPQTAVTFAVWDAGGDDTLDFSGYSNSQTIDLRAGNLSSVGGYIGNVAIAQGANIENAMSGSGSDVIHGNAGQNRIFGGAGADTIDGGTGGYNYMRGGDGDDVITGGVDFDDIQGNTGNDTEHGGLGGDWVVGGQNNDMLFGDDGDDVINGNLGSDTLDGGAGNDTVRGGQGDDVVVATAGDDWISGDLGNDTLAGGAGADTFHGMAGIGIDRIIDFNFAEGDHIVLDAGTAYSAAQVGADTVVTVTGGQMVLVGVQLGSLGAGWIV